MRGFEWHLEAAVLKIVQSILLTDISRRAIQVDPTVHV